MELAFLELMQPSLPACADALYAAGHRGLRVVPVFFGTGGHLRKDLPELVRQICVRHADLTVTVEPPIGEQPAVIEAIARTIAGQ